MIAATGGVDRFANGQAAAPSQAEQTKLGQAKAGQAKAVEVPVRQPPGLASREETTKPPLTQKQRDLQTDVKRLAVLAAELKVSVDKSTKDQLSLDVVRRADEIEKLAKSVKERMRAAQ